MGISFQTAYVPSPDRFNFRIYVVAEYSPRGNVEGAFKENVLPQRLIPVPTTPRSPTPPQGKFSFLKKKNTTIFLARNINKKFF